MNEAVHTPLFIFMALRLKFFVGYWNQVGF